MPVVCRKKQKCWMFLVFSLLFSMGVTACSTNVARNENAPTDNTLSKASTQTGKGTSSSSHENTDTNKTLSEEKTEVEQVKLRAGEEDWVTISPGEEAHGLKFTKDGALSYQGKVLLPNIPVSYVSDGMVKYAGRLIVSNPSPSGKFNFFKACEKTSDGSGSLCWGFYLVDKEKGKAKEAQPGKYGPLQWVQWSKDERYVIVAEQLEGSLWLFALDLQTGNYKQVKDGGWSCSNIDLNSFSWTSDRTFKFKLDHPQDCEQDAGKSLWVTGNINEIF